MSVKTDHIHTYYKFATCDICGYALEPEYGERDARYALEAAGWVTYKDSDGNDFDVCEECQEAGLFL